MPSYDQRPGSLGLVFRCGDSLSTEIDFSPVSLSGAAVTATLTSVVSGQTVSTAVVQVIDAAAGIVNVSMTKEQTAALAAGTYRWTLEAGNESSRRTYLAGFVEAVN